MDKDKFLSTAIEVPEGLASEAEVAKMARQVHDLVLVPRVIQHNAPMGRKKNVTVVRSHIESVKAAGTKYYPHQGNREIERRRRRASNGEAT